MRKTPLTGRKVAVLVANGFNEKDMTEVQKRLPPLGANIRIVGMDHGLVNSWCGAGWGLNFAVDNVLNAALSADFSMLVIPGGLRSVEKLRLTAHTRRFIGGFVDSGKPVVALNDAAALLAHVEKISGYVVSCPEVFADAVNAAGAQRADGNISICRNLMTGVVQGERADDVYDAVCDFIIRSCEIDESVAA